MGNIVFLRVGEVGSVASGYHLVGGNSYVSNTYTNVPLTGGTGSGAQATIVVVDGAVTSAVITGGGSGYTSYDILSASNSNLGGSGSGFQVSVQSVTASGAIVGLQWQYIASPTSSALNGIASNGTGTVMTIDTNGIAYTSTDGGNTWATKGTIDSTVMTNGIYGRLATAGGTWVYSGNGGVIARSTDGGATWVDHTTGAVAADLSSIYYTAVATNGSGTWIVITGSDSPGTSGTTPFAYSTNDGVSWTPADPFTGGQMTQGNIIWDGSKFVALILTDEDGDIAVCTSTNGISWSISSPFSETTYYEPLAFGNGKYIAGDDASNNVISASTTAGLLTATPALTTVVDTVDDVLAANGKYFAFDFGGDVSNSNDANTWATGTLNFLSGDADYASVYDPVSGNYIATGGYLGSISIYGPATVPTAPPAPGGEPIVTFSTLISGSGYVDGSYIDVPLTGGSGSGATAQISVYGGSVYDVQVSNPGINYQVSDTLSASNANLGGSGVGFSIQVASTDMGTYFTWNEQTSPVSGSGNLQSVHSYNGITLMTEIITGYIYKSTNGGSIWTQVKNGFTDVTLPSQFISPAASGTAAGIGFVDSRGVGGPILFNRAQNLTCSNGTWVYGGGTTVTQVAISTDVGNHWTAVNTNLTQTNANDPIEGIASDGNGKVVVTYGPQVAYSSDNGATWTAGTSLSSGINFMPTSITWDPHGNQFIAGGRNGPTSNYLLTSSNGASWTVTSTANRFYGDFVYLNGYYFAVGYYTPGSNFTDILVASTLMGLATAVPPNIESGYLQIQNDQEVFSVYGFGINLVGPNVGFINRTFDGVNWTAGEGDPEDAGTNAPSSLTYDNINQSFIGISLDIDSAGTSSVYTYGPVQSDAPPSAVSLTVTCGNGDGSGMPFGGSWETIGSGYSLSDNSGGYNPAVPDGTVGSYTPMDLINTQPLQIAAGSRNPHRGGFPSTDLVIIGLPPGLPQDFFSSVVINGTTFTSASATFNPSIYAGTLWVWSVGDYTSYFSNTEGTSTVVFNF